MSSYDFPAFASLAASAISDGATGQPGSSFLHLAMVPCGQPQSHGFELSTLSALKRCAAVRPAKASSAPISFSVIQSAGMAVEPLSTVRAVGLDAEPAPPLPPIGSLLPRM